MRIGFTLPQMGPLAHQAHEIGRFAKEAEELGADSLWVGDRILAPVEPSVGYGGGDGIPEVFRTVLDPFAVMAVAAAATERAEIGANVLQAPCYAPALLARSLTTLDLISEGRLLAGFGTGWSPEEYLAAGVPMKERGARLDEALDALEAWWTTDPVEFEGTYTRIPAAHVGLKPARRPHPPVYLAGFAPAAMRRVARRADGWLPVAQPGSGAFAPGSVNTPMAQVRRLAAEAGRDPSVLGLILRVYPTPEATLEEVVATITDAGRETDVDHCFVELMNIAHDVDHALELVRRVLGTAR
ncbi:TIGR03619 family F420-dependent LLM class oxidoreductase [Streptomyces sp. NBC_01754]|uniref:TIGR03619 family F420-dependent LLM class oxidoreductase n=1 Tax=Streptomyces sp. NBC_01754 TaxID=2975930 RepID=UPI002DDC3B0C|nr:TIGR03619 family F420-dependent LLM class oxidoreductase [Streptomyces sp. NBC_01754]WSC96283.1 TIGR03619 family F420-dependent LLM class oxidoreductase [Streptomyces sp. NBC_01754]